MGLFDRKYCDICKEKIGLLGNRKLEDGNLCKACAAKLSPWFYNRKHSTVAEIAAQLEYRENNRAKAAAFKKDREFGTYTKVYVDESARCFAVTSASDFGKANPDIISIDAVTEVSCEIHESRTELKTKDKDGKPVSFNPPRYEYSYKFAETISVDHPYISVIRFDLNLNAIKTRTLEPVLLPTGKMSAPMKPSVSLHPDYKKLVDMSRELKETLMPGTAQPEEEPAVKETEEAKPGEPVKCPWCGSMVTPDEEGCCPECTGPVSGR